MKLLAAAAAGLALLGCTGGDDATGSPLTTAPAEPAPTTQPGLGSPFCIGIQLMSARLDAEPPLADVNGFLVAAYTELLPVTPAALVPDVEAMIASLGGDPTTVPVGTAPAGTAAVTTVPADDVAPGVVLVNPADRIADYVAANCGRVESNPGPPATPPGGGYDTRPDTVPSTTSAP